MTSQFFQDLRRVVLPNWDELQKREQEKATIGERLTIFKSASSANPKPVAEGQHAPAAWSVTMDCGHRHILSDEALHNPDKIRRGADNRYYCTKCANGDRSGTGDHGFCTQSVYHSILGATPLFERQLLQRRQKQEQEQEQQEDNKQ